MIDKTLLTQSDIEYIHTELTNRFGGDNSIRDEGLLESCILTPYQTFGEKELYPSVFDKAARILTGFVTNQVFTDGNKRTGIAAALLFLRLHGFVTTYDEKMMTHMVMMVSTDSSIPLKVLSEFFEKNSKEVSPMSVECYLPELMDNYRKMFEELAKGPGTPLVEIEL